MKKRTKKLTSKKTAKRTRRKNPPPVRSLLGKWFLHILPTKKRFVIGKFEIIYGSGSGQSFSQLGLSPFYNASFYGFEDFWQYPNPLTYWVQGHLLPLLAEGIYKKTKNFATGIEDFYGPFNSQFDAFDFFRKKYPLPYLPR